MKKPLLIAACLLLAVGMVFAQWGRGRGRWRSWEGATTARDIPQHGFETPVWTNEAGFDADTFTFARVIRSNGGRGGRGGWDTDLPDSDLNLSYRLQQMTSLRVDPNGRLIRLTDPELPNYPFLYFVEPGGLYLDDLEAETLRNYLLNGGFAFFDDFWGEREWNNLAEEMKKVFPDRSFTELPLDHPLYSCVFQIKSKGQVPNVGTGTESQYTGITTERADAEEVHHRVIFDDQGRIMAFAAHNTDNGDGWEWEGDNHYYFANFSEKIAYPLAVNVIIYIMTH